MARNSSIFSGLISASTRMQMGVALIVIVVDDTCFEERNVAGALTKAWMEIRGNRRIMKDNRLDLIMSFL